MARRAQGVAAGLSRDRIAAAALAVVDRDGLARFGVRRLAEELGVDPMSIYNHIRGKAALLDAVAATVLAEAAAEIGEPAGDWEQIARRIAHGYRAAAHRHPQVVPLLATRPQTSPAALSALEKLVAAMAAAGLPEHIIADTPLVLFGFINGYLLAVLGGESTDAPTLPAIDATSYPTMAGLVPSMADFGSVAEFDRLLDAVLTGIRALSLTDS